MKRQTVRISVRVRSGAASFRVGIQAPSIREALALARSRCPRRVVRVVFPIEPEGFFVREPSALVGAAGSKQAPRSRLRNTQRGGEVSGPDTARIARKGGATRVDGTKEKRRSIEPSGQTNTEESQMNVPIDQEVSRQGREESRREATVALLEGIAHASRETGPYVVRDLRWEFARYLDTQTFPPNASTTSERTRE